MSAKEYSMMDVAPTVSAILNLPLPAKAKGDPIEEIVADLNGRTKVAILVPDALGLFAWKLWKHQMPYLDSLHSNRSIVLRSVMPSVTPVNFASIVSGTDVEGHGVRVYNGNFSCETLFDVIRDANRKSAGVGLDDHTGCELMGKNADICGNAGEGSDDDIADKVIEIVDTDEPDFLIAQFVRVDYTFHKHGPSSPMVVPMLVGTDARMNRLVDHLHPLGYGILILSDHGQHDLPAISPEGKKGDHGMDTPEDRLVPCTWI
jgi:predicted AlkP superfamily pyrophosphatase or phosphodiesterase